MVMLPSRLIDGTLDNRAEASFLKTGAALNFGSAAVAHDSEKKLKTGTTTLGIICKDCIVLAADQKATMGHLIASKNAKKVHEITNKMAMTIAGDVGDAQALIRLLRAEMKLYELAEKTLTTKAAATLMGNILRGSYKSWMPEMVQLLLGGADERGVQLYSLTPDGAVMDEDEYSFSGSGSVFAIGVLEDGYRKDMPMEDGINLAVRAINAARERDVFTGGKAIDVITITQKEGLKHVPKEKIEEMLKKIQKK